MCRSGTCGRLQGSKRNVGCLNELEAESGKKAAKKKEEKWRMAELKECPFCGKGDELVIVSNNYHSRYRVECEGCRSAGPEEYTKSEAVKSWNARA